MYNHLVADDLARRHREDAIGDLAARALELSRLALLTISPGGKIGVWNRAASEIYGYSEAEAIGRAVDFLCFPGQGTALRSGPGEVHDREVVEKHRRRDGSEVYVELRLAASGDGLLACARDVSSERLAHSSLAASRDALGASRGELHRLAGRLLGAQEDERRRIARELHDDFKQRLTALGFEIAGLAQRARDGTEGEPLAERLDALVRMAAELGDDVRGVSRRLHPAALERLGLAAALEAHALEVEARAGLEIRVTVRDEGEPLAEDIALSLYRIAQEALENSARHSGARRAHLTLVRDGAAVKLALADDGAGFDLDEARELNGLGLASMEERARLLGGRLRVASSPGAGTEIEVIVPLDGGAADTADEADEAAVSSRRQLIGPYQLLAILGEGATATVYLAREPPPLAREVAIKLYHDVAAGRRLVYSFKAERQALARLSHPNIGRIHEARTTEDGAPYLVMEYVPGMPITDYCDRYRLDLERRVELFMQVCEGVRHIHQKGVLHRDLKPANVLVMEQGGQAMPKIVDFGIAKGIEEPLAEGTVWSRSFGGTPAYLSPEVLTGADADTRSDVYALGVILYELLAGVQPAATEADLVEQLAGAGSPRPSHRLAALDAETVARVAAERRIGPRALTRALSGDLDWIADKALAVDPDARYDSVSALAADLERQLRHEPVHVRPPALTYRLASFARRHRAAAVAAALGLLALFGGLATTAWQARRAAREATVAERARAEAEQRIELLEGDLARMEQATTLPTSALELGRADSTLDEDDALDSRLTSARVALARGDLERAEAEIREILSVVDPARFRYPELIELCQRHGIDVPPLDD